MPLTQRDIDSARSTNGKSLKLHDRDGLLLLVSPSKKKSWHLRVRSGRKDTTILLGAYPDMDLRAARREAVLKRDEITAKPDPSDTPPVPAFGEMLRQFEKDRMQSVAKATLTRFGWLSGHLASLATRPLDDIKPADVMTLCSGAASTAGPETGRRMCALIRAVYDYALASGKFEGFNPAASVAGALPKANPVGRAAIIEPKRFGELLRAIDVYAGRGMTSIGLQILPLLACRPGELRHATWKEFSLDGNAPVWRIPAERAKTRTDHTVPLSRQAVELIRSCDMYTDANNPDAFILDGRRGRPLSENAFGVALDSLKFNGKENAFRGEHTAHGFRSSFSTLMHERGWSPDIIELCLAHRIPGVRKVYMRSTMLDERTKLMQAWADYCDELKAAPQ